MQYRSRLSSKGRVTIPSELRKQLRLELGDTVIYEFEGECVVLRAAQPTDVTYHAALAATLDEWASEVSVTGDLGTRTARE